MDRAAELNRFWPVVFDEPDEVGFDDFEPRAAAAAAYATDWELADLFWNHDAIELAAAHKITRGSEKTVVIIVDSGIRTDHPDLAPALPPGWTSLDLNFDLDVSVEEKSPNEEQMSHGTQVAGVAAGRRGDATVVSDK